MRKLTEHSILNRKIELAAGHTLGYTECGEPDGSPVFCFDGWPSSRLSVWQYDEQMIEAGIRLIGVDRPGLGLSSYNSSFTMLDWPDQIEQLANSLNIERFAVLGISAGTPYALSCAYKMGKRISGCALLSAISPSSLSSLLFKISAFPFIFKPYITYLLSSLKREEAQLRERLKLARTGPEKARPDLTDVYKRMRTIAHVKEALRPGMEGALYEIKLIGKNWGFPLEDIKLENIHLWHGERDRETSAVKAQKMARAIPHCRAKLFPAESHSSLITGTINEIIELIRPESPRCCLQQNLELSR